MTSSKPQVILNPHTEEGRDSPCPKSYSNSGRRSWRPCLPASVVRLFERFGILDTIVLPLGTIVIIVTLGILTVLWEFGNRTTVDKRTGYLSDLVVHGRGTRVVTVSSAMLRVCIFAQTLTCSYMMASLAIDYNQIKKGSDRDLMTVYTKGNSGPNNILFLLFKGRSFKHQPLGFAVVVSMSLCVIVSQFFSTFLISDMESIDLRGNNITETVRYTQHDIPELGPAVAPSQYPLFAETSLSNLSENPGRDLPGYADSGVTIRAYFPFGSDKRQSIGSYDGPASLAKIRYLCFPPDLDRFNVTASNITGLVRIPPRVLDYTAKLSKQLKQDYFDISPYVDVQDWQFNCTLRFQTITTCILPAFNISPSSDGTVPDRWNLVIHAHFPGTEHISGTEYSREWANTMFKFSDDLYLPLKYSLCASQSDSTVQNIYAEATKISSEPRLDGQGKYNMGTQQIQGQLEVENKNRSIFNLQRISPRPKNEADGFNPGSYWKTFDWCINMPEKKTFQNFSGGCGGGNIMTGSTTPIDGLHSIFQAIFRNTLHDTGLLVLSIHAVQSLLFSSAYYDNLYTYDKEDNATIRLFANGQAPVQWQGYATVVFFVMLHFTLMALIVSVYLQSESFENLPSHTQSYEAVDKDEKDTCDSVGFVFDRHTLTEYV